MNKQNLLSGEAPWGSYQSSQTVDSNFFTEEEDLRREGQVREGMPFLNQLLQSKLEFSNSSRRKSSEKRKRRELPNVTDNDSESGDLSHTVDVDQDDDEIAAEKAEGVEYIQEQDLSKSEAHRLRMVRGQ